MPTFMNGFSGKLVKVITSLYMFILFIVIYLVSSLVKGNAEVKENEAEASPPQANTNSTGKFQ